MATRDDDTTDGGRIAPKLRLVRENGKPVDRPAVETRQRDKHAAQARRRSHQPGDDGARGGSLPRRPRANTKRVVEHLVERGWGKEIRYNVMAELIEVRSPTWLVHEWLREGVADGGWRPLHDADLLEALVLLQEDYPALHVGGVLEALRLVAHRGAVHPVRDYLLPLVWDRTPRLHRLFVHYFRARLPTNKKERAAGIAYLEQIAVCFGVAAVARVMEPGCKVDNSVVIAGDQGFGKSKAVRALCPLPDLFTEDIGTDVGAPDTKISLAQKWLIELAEGALLGAEPRQLKAFLTRRIDHFRLPYAHLPLDKKRQSVFVFTVNPDTELDDPTGNRRYWPFWVAGPIDAEAIARDRDQLWAEALHLYRNGELHYLSAAGEKLAAEQRVAFEREPDPLLAEIEPWVEGKLKSVRFFRMPDLMKALGFPVTDARAVTLQHRIGALLKTRLGCRPDRPKSGKQRDQRIWVRDGGARRDGRGQKR
jgi:predicted P-loop ATPase